MTQMSRGHGKTKAIVFQELMQRGRVVMHLDSRAQGVILPKDCLNRPHVALIFGHNLPVPIEDLYIDYQRWSCILSFNRTPFHCSAPWEAVFTLTNELGGGRSWPHDIPPEVLAEIEQQIAAEKASPGYPRGKTGAAATTTELKPKRQLPPGWKVIDGEKS